MMSGLVKEVKKVFKKVVRFVKKHWKTIVLAAAVYFTAGVALSSFGSTAGFASSMPGFGAGGVFSKAAVALGFQGAAGSGIAATAAAQTAMAAGAGAAAGASLPGVAGTGVGVGEAGAAFAMPGSQAAAAQAAGTAATGAAATGVAGAAGTAAAGAAKSLSALEKIAIAQTIFQGVGGLMTPDQDELDRKAHARRNQAAFGIGRSGEGPGFGGITKDIWAGAFGDSGDTPFGPPQEEDKMAAPPLPGAFGAGQEQDPFKSAEAMTAQSEAEATRDQQVISSGYRNRDYRPV